MKRRTVRAQQEHAKVEESRCDSKARWRNQRILRLPFSCFSRCFFSLFPGEATPPDRSRAVQCTLEENGSQQTGRKGGPAAITASNAILRGEPNKRPDRRPRKEKKGNERNRNEGNGKGGTLQQKLRITDRRGIKGLSGRAPPHLSLRAVPIPSVPAGPDSGPEPHRGGSLWFLQGPACATAAAR